MAASKTMAEIVAASTAAASDKKQGGGVEPSQAGTEGEDNKEENGSSSAIINSFPHLTITVYIPTVCVGVLIGKRGYTIDKIQRQAAAESTKAYSASLQTASRGVGRNNTSNNKFKQKKVSPDSVRISVVNYPPPHPTAQQHQQNYENYDNPQYTMVTSEDLSSSPGQHQLPPLGGGQQSSSSSSAMDMGVPPTYTELDFSNPQWTPIVIRADPIAAIYASQAIHDICCPEYLADRKQLVYIMDVPVPAVANANGENGNLRHASIVGKKGNKLIQLSADHQCRIMVPPKQLGHNVIQLEAPLQECRSCLKAISIKLQADSPTDELPDAKESLASPQQTKNARNRNKIETAKSNYQITLIVQPLPSQTKLRNIARKTETKILRKKIPKSQQKQKQRQLEQQRREHQRQQQQQQQQQGRPLEESMEQEDLEEESEQQEQQEEQEQEGANTPGTENGDGTTSNKPPSDSWRLTIVATTEKKATKALEMLKVLVSKGYEVLVEEMGTTVNSETAGATGATEAPVTAAMATMTMTGTDSEENLSSEAGEDGARTASATNNSNKAGGRGSRSKKKKKYLYK